MAKCNPFTIPFQGSAKDLVARAKKAIEDAGGTFKGNTSSGSFEITRPVKIAGKYSISGQNITITITERPFFVPCGRIESELRKLLGATAAVAGLTASVSTHAEDLLPHLDDTTSLAGRASTLKGCFTFLGVIKVCWNISGNEIEVTVDLDTPFGSVKLGSFVLNPSHTCATVGGGAFGFKAEVEVCMNFQTLELKICGTVCAPIVGCKKGCTSVHL